MLGDYISTSFSGGKDFPVFVVARTQWMTIPRGRVNCTGRSNGSHWSSHIHR
jgi:hypothetical protein